MLKKKKIVKLISNNKFLVDEFPVEKYSKNPPKWFKDIHVNLSEYADINDWQTTAKGCAGIWDFLKSAYIIRWNFDLKFNIHETETYEYYPRKNKNMVKDITFFSPPMYSIHTPVADNKLTLNTIKIDLNWFITSQTKGKVLMTDPFFNYNKEYKIISGVVEPKYSNGVNVIIEPSSPVINIKRGDPALAVIPLDGQKLVTEYGNSKDWNIVNKNFYKQDTMGSGWYERYRKQDK